MGGVGGVCRLGAGGRGRACRCLAGALGRDNFSGLVSLRHDRVCGSRFPAAVLPVLGGSGFAVYTANLSRPLAAATLCRAGLRVGAFLDARAPSKLELSHSGGGHDADGFFRVVLFPALSIYRAAYALAHGALCADGELGATVSLNCDCVLSICTQAGDAS